MKGKKLLTLLSIFAGAAVVGTTFAAWAVTDNADPFKIKVSPGSISPDTTEFVTLSYGDSSFGNVDNLEAGVPRLAGSVKLLADTTSSDPFNQGAFIVSLAGKNGTEQLVTLLHVDVYEGEVEVKASGTTTVTYSVVKKGTEVAATKIGEIPTEEAKYNAEFPLTVPAAGKIVSVVVSLSADIDAATLNAVKSDVVYLTMDWGLKTGATDIIDSSTLYLAYASGKKAYCYAWKGLDQNAAFPGVEMTDLGGGYYSADIKASYEKVVFSVYDAAYTEGATPVMKTSDQTLTNTILNVATGTPTFTPDLGPGESGTYGGNWGAKPNDSLTYDFYVTGDEKGNWQPDNSFGLTAVAGKDNEYISEALTFVKDELFKVCSKNRLTWFTCASSWENCHFEVLEGGNLKVTDAGTYKVHLYTQGDGGNCIVLETVTA